MSIKLTPSSMVVSILLTTTLLSAGFLMSVKSYADNNTAVDNVEITVPVSCTMTGSVQTSHTATLNPGTYSGASGSEYENGIGKTTLTTHCNDNNGFSIYAIGYTGDADGTNTLVGTNTGSTIATKAYESTDTTSNWSMKVNKVDNPSQGDPVTWNPNNMTIKNSFNAWHAVPNDYTQVAEYKSTTEPATTDTTLGAKVETTYATYISTNQPADTYTGQVKYVMVHPYNGTAPRLPISSITELEYLQDFAILTSAEKTDVLSSMDTNTTYSLKDNRDQISYNLAKLADGNVWMQDNLALDLTDSAILSGMSNNNTNASNTSLGYLKGNTARDPNTDSTGKYAIDKATNWTSGYSFSVPLVNLADKDVIPADDISTTGEYKVGGYYNYCAATAGSYCYGSGRTSGPTLGDATEDICPSGWRMPTGNTGGDYSVLTNAIYGSTGDTSDATAYNNYRVALHLPLSGVGNNASINGQGSYGYWWSSTEWHGYGSIYTLSVLGIGNNHSISPAGNASCNYGYSMRCILAE